MLSAGQDAETAEEKVVMFTFPYSIFSNVFEGFLVGFYFDFRIPTQKIKKKVVFR